MKQNKDYNKLSIKWKLFIYIAGFALVMILLLWLFQVVFLNDFYKSIKTNQIKDTAHEVALNVGNDQLSDFIDEKSENSDYCIRIVNMDEGTIAYGNAQNKGICGYLITDVNEISDLYIRAKSGDGTIIKDDSISVIGKFDDYTKRYDIYSDETPFTTESESETQPPTLRPIDKQESITYGEIVETDSSSYFVLVNSRITIVDEIAETIRTQLFIITIILLLLALLLAFVISSRVSKPIIKINESAKDLAKGNFEVTFEGKGYLEIEELNDTLNYASVELSKVENLRNELIANMSHDLRTPLTMIAGYGEVMRDLPGENTPENVQVIIDECHRLTRLVNDILDLSKLQSKTQSLEKENFNITTAIDDITKRFTKLLEKEHFQIRFMHDESINVYADPVKINQVIYNLLVNATHYAGEDKEIIVRQIVSGNKVRIEVEDHGEGISQENLPYIWDRYYKLDKVHKRNSVGSGLGLSIVKGVLELHEATYGVKSKIDEGTTFYFELEKA